ncbi:hypothetical protein ACQ5SO_10135 [Rhodovulum sp. DZ06]|uniref:hypothetical protein n=1 Tax=Rhodovulum sp. DZ06 TaxID=3425126 RepID=UPI003D32A991
MPIETFETLAFGDRVRSMTLRPERPEMFASALSAVFGADFQRGGGDVVGNGAIEVVPGPGGRALQCKDVNAVFTAPLAAPLKRVSFAYVYGGGNVNLAANGVARNEKSVGDLDGVQLGGARVKVEGPDGLRTGTLTLEGLIRPQFVFGHLVAGGQNLTIGAVDYDWG